MEHSVNRRNRLSVTFNLENDSKELVTSKERTSTKPANHALKPKRDAIAVIPGGCEGESKVGGTKFYFSSSDVEAHGPAKNKSKYQETFKKKYDPYAHHPSAEERAKSEEARCFLQNASEQHHRLFQGTSIELVQFEKIVEGATPCETYLIAIGLTLKASIRKSSLEVFDRWLKKNYPVSVTRNMIESLLTNEIKDAIFDFFFVEDLYFSKLAYRIFNLAAQGEKYKQRYKAVIKNLITKPNHDYKSALVLSTVLELQRYIPWTSIVIPAILMSIPKDHYEEFLEGDEVRTKQFIKWLDDLYEDNSKKIANLHATYVNLLPKLDFNRLNYKALEKFIKTSIERYGLGPEVAPNFIGKKEFLALRYLVLNERDGKPTNIWRDLVEQRVAGNITLQIKLIELLEREDIYEAAFWAKKLKLKQVSKSVAAVLQNIEQGLDNFPADEDSDCNEKSSASNEAMDPSWGAGSWSNSEWSNCGWSNSSTLKRESFYNFPLSQSAIILIDDVNGLKEFTNYIKSCTEYTYGLDSEFGPSSVLSKGSIATIQIASAQKVYILDIVTLSNVENIEIEFEHLIKAFFCNNSIQIVGYGLSNDWNFLSNTHKAFKDIETKMAVNCLDLCNLVSRVTKGYGSALFELPYEKEENQGGLSGLTLAIFNMRLDKTYQQSNWTKRPLLAEQITYAALDALICVRIFNELESLASKSNQIPKFHEWCDTLKKHRNKLPKDFGQKKPTASTNELNVFSEGKRGLKIEGRSLKPEKPLNKEPIEPPDLKVVCENMLNGLCKKLRLQGVDAEVLEPYEYFEVAKERAEKEGRMILTKSLNHVAQLKKIFKKEHVLYITESNLEEQIKEVYWYFNVQPDEKYVFSRCPKCNCRCYITLDGDVMKKLHQNLSSLDDSQNKSDDGTIVLAQNRKCRAILSNDESPDNQYFKCKGGDVSMRTGRVKFGGTQLRIKDVHRNVISSKDEFFGCVKCGKIFWEGSHWNRYLGKFNGTRIVQ